MKNIQYVCFLSVFLIATSCDSPEAKSEIKTNPENNKIISSELKNFAVTINKLSEELKNVYVNNLPTFAKKDASKEELILISEKLNQLRGFAFEEVVGFHMLVKKHSSEEEWNKIMKSFNNELVITN